MAENGIISRSDAEHLADMARFRNRLVHSSWRIDDDVIWDILITDRDDIAEYAKNILVVLNNPG